MGAHDFIHLLFLIRLYSFGVGEAVIAWVFLCFYGKIAIRHTSTSPPLVALPDNNLADHIVKVIRDGRLQSSSCRKKRRLVTRSCLRPSPIPEQRPRQFFNLDEFLKRAKLCAFDIGMTIVFFVWLYHEVMHGIGR